MNDGLVLVLHQTKEDGKTSIDAKFIRDGEEITYSEVTTEEKYHFADVCKNMMGCLAHMVIAELGKEEE